MAHVKFYDTRLRCVDFVVQRTFFSVFFSKYKLVKIKHLTLT